MVDLRGARGLAPLLTTSRNYIDANMHQNTLVNSWVVCDFYTLQNKATYGFGGVVPTHALLQLSMHYINPLKLTSLLST